MPMATDGWVSVHYPGAMGDGKQSPGALPGCHRAPAVMPSVVWASEVSVADGHCRTQGPLPPQSKTSYSFTLVS